jgi:adenine-specific DNA-methyltransferase
MTDQPERLDLSYQDIASDKMRELLSIFPEARTEDGKIDFERLKLVLGESVDVGKERYGMNWPGKADCFKTIQQPSVGTLRPCPEESINFDTTENLIIEGDNLEVLKLLQKSYLGKVKMIYIDPPYNTGNDFIYPDNFTESLQTYLEYTGQVDAEGKKFGTNSDADGRFHSKWLNMMYPRLYLARNLLKEDGLIFISIDDNEVDNLRKLCNEIFGEEAFMAQFIWKSRQNKDNRNVTGISVDHEYVLCYGQRVRGDLRKIDQYTNPDNDIRGPWTSGNMVGLLTEDLRPNCHYDLINPETKLNYGKPKLGWRYDKSTMSRLIAEDRIIWPDKITGRPRRKTFLSELKQDYTGYSSIIGEGIYTRDGTAEINDLFGEKVIEFPKPTALLKELIEQGTQQQDLIMDFFAGSGTTAHSVFELNHPDGGSRKFVLVQLPEPCAPESVAYKAGFKTIADITKERVRRCITKLNDADTGKMGLDGVKKQDRGFRVFKLAESNFKSWNAQGAQDAEELEKQLELHIAHIREDRSPDDILYEILLKSGFPLTTPVEKVIFAGKTVYSAADGALFICLENEVTLELIRVMAGKKPARVVCLDAGFVGNDQLKTNAVLIFKNKGVNFRTV